MHHAFHPALAQAHAAELQRIAAEARVARTRPRFANMRAAKAAAALTGALLMLIGL